MVKLLLFCLLLMVCWPLALMALVLYPVVWMVLLPFRLVGLCGGGGGVGGGGFALVGAILYLPVRVLRAVIA